MTALERHLHHLDVIAADMQAVIKDATDEARTAEQLALLDERLAVTAHWLANQRQALICLREMNRRHGVHPVTESLDTTGGS